MSSVPQLQLDPASLVVDQGTGDPVLKGVRISCGGDKEVLKAKAYVSVEVLMDGLPLLSNSIIGYPVSPISQLVGMPVYVGRYGPDPAYLGSSATEIHLNPEALFLMRELDAAKEDFGFAPMEWQMAIHNCLIIRLDGRDLTPHQVEALCEFAGPHLTEALEKMRELSDDEGVKKEHEKVLALITPKKFRDFFLELRLKKMGDDMDWVGAICPV